MSIDFEGAVEEFHASLVGLYSIRAQLQEERAGPEDLTLCVLIDALHDLWARKPLPWSRLFEFIV